MSDKAEKDMIAIVEEAEFKHQENVVNHTDVVKLKSKIAEIKHKLAIFEIHYKEALDTGWVDSDAKLSDSLAGL